MLKKVGRWRIKIGFLLIICILGFISTCLIFQKNEGLEKSRKYVNRRLKTGDPSGFELQTPLTRIDTTEVENSDKEGEETGIKISVTLATRNKKEGLAKQIKNANKLEQYKERKVQVSSTCRRYGLGRFPTESQSDCVECELYQHEEGSYPWPASSNLLYQESWHLLYCWVHKVASTSWSKVFFNLVGREVPPTRLHEAAQQFSIQPSQLPGAISNSLVFMVVRHPFERLVSAYRDKFELAKKYAYVYSRYAYKILGLKTQAEAERSRRPTFSEFVSYILRTPVQEFNDHWVPYWLHCHMCEMEYDIIGKMETIKDDMEFIAEKSGLAATNITLPWTNRRNSSEDTSLQYFQTLSVNQVVELYRVYKIDFQMFNYKVDRYLALFSHPVP